MKFWHEIYIITSYISNITSQPLKKKQSKENKINTKSAEKEKKRSMSKNNKAVILRHLKTNNALPTKAQTKGFAISYTLPQSQHHRGQSVDSTWRSSACNTAQESHWATKSFSQRKPPKKDPRE